MQIGSFCNGDFTSNSGFPNSPSRCGLNKNCSSCIIDDKLNFAYIPGDVLILGIFSVRDHDTQSVFKCGGYRITSNTVMTIASFLHSIESINKMAANNGIKFGGIALDDCYNPYNITDLLTKLFSKKEFLTDHSSGNIINFDHVIAAVGALSSKVTLIVADLLTALNIPMISYGASSAGLDDRVRYPYFLRTVPSDTLQVAGLVEVLKEMELTHVAAVYIDDAYGQNGIRAFKELAQRNGICVEEEKIIGQTASFDEIKRVVDQISIELPTLDEKNSRKFMDFLYAKRTINNIHLGIELSWCFCPYLTVDSLQRIAA